MISRANWSRAPSRAASSAMSRCSPSACGATVRGTYGTPETGTRAPHEAGTRSPYEQYGGPRDVHVSTAVRPRQQSRTARAAAAPRAVGGGRRRPLRWRGARGGTCVKHSRRRPLRPSARPASARASPGRPPASASLGQLADVFWPAGHTGLCFLT
eukprot:scaffold49980_cov78-Phaeocystis_antarctica.AAC.1